MKYFGDDPSEASAMADPTAASSSSADSYFSRHIPCGAVCKYCHRKDTDANPMTHQCTNQPTIPWRRQFGQECAICMYAIKGSESYAKMSVTDIVVENRDPAKRAEFMEQVVKPYEERKNGSGGKRVYQSGKKTAMSTTAKQYCALEYKNTVGILWPIAIYNASVDTGPPSRRLIQTHIINGQRVRGILRDPTHGCPPGCFEVYGVSGTSAEKSSVLANDGELDDDGEKSSVLANDPHYHPHLRL